MHLLDKLYVYVQGIICRVDVSIREMRDVVLFLKKETTENIIYQV